MLMLHQPFCLFDHHLRDLHVPNRRLVKGRAYDLTVHRPRHIGYFFRPLVDQQDDQIDLRMIAGNGMGNILHDHRLAGPRLRHDQTALTFSNWRHQFNNPACVVALLAVTHRRLDFEL